ncbi:MAG: 30S ribosomal protein S2 [Patescibacteria group bacterium]
MDKNTVIEKLFSVGAHFGYTPSRRHPSVSKFIFGAKGGTELFDLEKTADALEAALAVVKTLAANRKTILFVGGKAEARAAVERTADRLNQPYVASRWIGGTLTNFQEINKRLSRLTELTDMREKGELAKFIKYERLLIDREITDLEVMFGGLKGMTKIPDAMFVVDPKKEAGAVEEARQLNIPVIALLNSDCDIKSINYPIPANDASVQSIGYVLEEVAKTYESNLVQAAPAESAATAIVSRA